MNARRRVAVWCVWSAALAVLLYFRASIDAAPMVVVPGQAGNIPVGVALLVALAWGTVRKGYDESCPSYKVRRTVGLMGLAATVVLVIVEAVLGANRGFPYLDDMQVTVYETIGVFEEPCSTLALSGWAAWGVGLGAVPANSSVSLLGVFTVGALWPCLCALSAFAPQPLSAAFSAVVWALSAALAPLVVRLICARNLSPGFTVVPFLSGQLAFVLARAIAHQNQWEFLDELLPVPMLYGVFMVVVVAFVAALILVMWFRRRVHWEWTAPVPGKPDEASIADVLHHRSEKPLTKRELAVLVRTVQGDTAQGIAAELGIAEATVATYRRRGYEKLCVQGAVELRKLAGDAISVTRETVEKNASLACPRHVAILLAIAALPMIQWPCDLEVAPGYWVGATGPYAVLGLSSIALLFGVFRRILCAEFPWRDEYAPYSVSDSLRLSLMLVAMLLAAVTCHAWYGYGSYELSGMTLLAFLAFLVLAEGPYADQQRGHPVRRVLGKLSAFMRHVAWDDGCLLALAASLVVTASLDSSWFDIINSLYSFRHIVILLVCLGLFARFLAEAKEPKDHPNEKRSNRVLLYLEGRGLGELQAQVILDLACGYAVREIAERRCVTVATVRAYRQRAYNALGVHSIAELRDLLSRDAGFTNK